MMQTGFFVKRAGWSGTKYAGIDDYGLFIKASQSPSSPVMHFCLSLEDLISNDWERLEYTPRDFAPDRGERFSLPPKSSLAATVAPERLTTAPRRRTKAPAKILTRAPLALKK
jgi:hypothetical protein